MVRRRRRRWRSEGGRPYPLGKPLSPPLLSPPSRRVAGWIEERKTANRAACLAEGGRIGHGRQGRVDGFLRLCQANLSLRCPRRSSPLPPLSPVCLLSLPPSSPTGPKCPTEARHNACALSSSSSLPISGPLFPLLSSSKVAAFISFSDCCCALQCSDLRTRTILTQCQRFMRCTVPYVSVAVWKSCVYSARDRRRGRT